MRLPRGRDAPSGGARGPSRGRDLGSGGLTRGRCVGIVRDSREGSHSLAVCRGNTTAVSHSVAHAPVCNSEATG